MPTRGPGNDGERLPWLEPYRDSAKALPRAAPSSRTTGGKRGAVIVGGLAAVVAALTGGYWVGQRETSPPFAPSDEIALAPVTPPSEAVTPPIAEAVENAPPSPPVVAPAEAEPAAVVAQPPRKAAKRFDRQRQARGVAIHRNHGRALRVAQARPPTRLPVVHRAWPKMPSPGPAGQVIQLGAFRHPSGANAALRTQMARYPSLGRMPRVVVPVITKPTGQILYVLRLGTTSRQQSKIVCRNLRASGDHCLVIG